MPEILRACNLNQTIAIITDNPQYDPQCEALYARNFGPGRFAKAAARLREGNTCRRDLSVVAMVEDAIGGACRLWPIVSSKGSHALFLGPIAVDVSMRSAGLGKRMIEACLAKVDASSSQCVILVGDFSFFGPLGFEVIPDGVVQMPGPVDRKRLLWRTGRHEFLPQGHLSVPRATNPIS